MKKVLTSLTALAVIVSAMGIGTANADVVYSDDFGGSSGSDLNGTTPDTVSGDFGTSGATWDAAVGFKADGSLSGGFESALLPFEPEAGWSYTLTVPFVNDGNSWTSMGFANGSATTSEISQSNGMAHIISRNQNDYHVMAGVGYESLAYGDVDASTLTEYVLTLDATDGLDQVKVSASIDGTSVLTESLVDYSSSGKGEIKYVQLSKQGSAPDAHYDSLTLTATGIPEPASLALLGLGGLLIAGRRRRRN